MALNIHKGDIKFQTPNWIATIENHETVCISESFSLAPNQLSRLRQATGSSFVECHQVG